MYSFLVCYVFCLQLPPYHFCFTSFLPERIISVTLVVLWQERLNGYYYQHPLGIVLTGYQRRQVNKKEECSPPTFLYIVNSMCKLANTIQKHDK